MTIGRLRHIYVVPANRVLNERIFNYDIEIDYVKGKYDLDITRIVFDDAKDPLISENNRRICDKHNWFFLSYSQQVEMFEKIVSQIRIEENDKRILHELFFPKELSYGAIANRIIVFSNYFHFDVIHRRDSDTALYEKGQRFPMDFEIEILKKEKFPYIVGGGYIGDWAIAYEDVSDEILYELVLNGYMYSGMKEIEKNINFRFINNEMIEDEGYSQVNNLLVELGNCMMTKIYSLLPCNPAKYTNGVDYIYHWIANSMGIGQYYHSAKVRHLHPKHEKKEYLYHYGFAKSRATNVYFYELYNDLELKKSGAVINNKQIIQKIVNNFNFIELEKKSRQVLRRHIDLLKQEDAYVEIAQRLNDDYEKIIREVKRDIYNYQFLLRFWEKILMIRS